MGEGSWRRQDGELSLWGGDASDMLRRALVILGEVVKGVVCVYGISVCGGESKKVFFDLLILMNPIANTDLLNPKHARH